MVKENAKTAMGIVMETLPDTSFKVKVEGLENQILAHLSGKMRIHRIKVIVGDRVKLEMSPYGDRGRIVQRL